jgi:hypothetical protein
MKIFPIVPLMVLSLQVAGADPLPTPPEPVLTPALKPIDGPPWLGFRVSKPDEATRSHLPDLPVGIGFVIQTIDVKGPAETCGLKALDVVWKFGDQLLVNEAQLATLLRLKKPGEVVPLSIFRSGLALQIPMVLGAFPLSRPLAIGPELDAATIPGENPRWYSMNPENRTAALVNDAGKAVLKRINDGGGYELEIRAADGELIFNGNLPTNGDSEAVPSDWRRQVSALRRALDNVLEGKMEQVRAPRPRLVPGPVEVR